MKRLPKLVFVLQIICFSNRVTSNEFCPSVLVLSTVFSQWVDVLKSDETVVKAQTETNQIKTNQTDNSTVTQSKFHKVKGKSTVNRVNRELSIEVKRRMDALKKRVQNLREEFKNELEKPKNNQTQDKLTTIYLTVDMIASELKHQKLVILEQLRPKLRRRIKKMQRFLTKFKENVMEAVAAPFYQTVDKLTVIEGAKPEVREIRKQVAHLKRELKEVLDLSGLNKIVLRMNRISKRIKGWKAQGGGVEAVGEVFREVKAFATRTLNWILSRFQ